MQLKMKDITQSICKKYLSYDRKTGDLYWKSRNPDEDYDEHSCNRFNSRFAGKKALASVHPTGYKVGYMHGVRVNSHRIIWLMIYGEWPNQIDHINGNRADNRLDNLRNVNQQQNSKNRRAVKKRGEKVHGVVWLKRSQKWWPRINDENGKQVSLGLYESLEDARKARKDAEIKYGYHKNHGGKVEHNYPKTHATIHSVT